MIRPTGELEMFHFSMSCSFLLKRRNNQAMKKVLFIFRIWDKLYLKINLSMFVFYSTNSVSPLVSYVLKVETWSRFLVESMTEIMSRITRRFSWGHLLDIHWKTLQAIMQTDRFCIVVCICHLLKTSWHKFKDQFKLLFAVKTSSHISGRNIYLADLKSCYCIVRKFDPVRNRDFNIAIQLCCFVRPVLLTFCLEIITVKNVIS